MDPIVTPSMQDLLSEALPNEFPPRVAVTLTQRQMAHFGNALAILYDGIQVPECALDALELRDAFGPEPPRAIVVIPAYAAEREDLPAWMSITEISARLTATARRWDSQSEPAQRAIADDRRELGAFLAAMVVRS